MSEIRVLPLPKVTGVWKYDASKYPDVIKVPMSDGRIVKYRIDEPLPAPVFREKLDRFNEVCGYPPKGEANGRNP